MGFQAAAMLGGGLFSAFGLLLFATGRTREAYAIGAVSSLATAAIGGIILLARRR